MKEYELGLYEKAMPGNLTWLEKLQLCKSFGFDYLEMSIDESEEKIARLSYSTQERKNLVEAMYMSGTRIQSICLSAHRKYPLGHMDETIQKKALDIMENAVQLACDLGIRIIQLAGYDVYYEKGNEMTKENFEKNLRLAVHMASKKGILLGFETMETSFMDTLEKSMKYVDAIDSPFLGVYPDIGNLKNASLLYDISVHDDLMKGKGKIIAAHLKETRPGFYREIPYGTGHSEFRENINDLKELGVRMFVGEFWYIEGSDWQQECKKSAKFLNDKLQVAFKEEMM